MLKSNTGETKNIINKLLRQLSLLIDYFEHSVNSLIVFLDKACHAIDPSLTLISLLNNTLMSELWFAKKMYNIH